MVYFLLLSLGPDTKTVEKFLYCYDPLARLFIQALDVHLRMPLIMRCVHKNPGTLEFNCTGCINLSWLLHGTLNLAFSLYTLDIWHTRLRVGHNS